jgi:hypothetical protein
VRLLVCLPLCLLLAPTYPRKPLAAVDNLAQQVPTSKQVVDKSLPDPAADPIGFLEACLKRYEQQKIRAYSLEFHKQERIDGEQQPLEVVLVSYRDEPYSVFFHWIQPPRRSVQRALYVEGQNKGSDGKSRVKVYTSLGLTFDKDPNGAEAKKYGRYPINTFGLRQAMELVLKSWRAAKAENTLHVEYLGQEVVQQTGGRTCYKFRRPKYARPESEDGASGLTVYIDCETLLQVGSIVLGQDGKELGVYFFRNIRLNPEFPAWRFDADAIRKDKD